MTSTSRNKPRFGSCYIPVSQSEVETGMNSSFFLRKHSMKRILMTLALLLTSNVIVADDYILIVVDTSGSMGEYMRTAKSSRMEVAQTALKEVLSKVPTSTKVAILSFDGWVYNKEFRTTDKQQLIVAISGMKPGGGTPLYEYLRSGATELLKIRANAGNTGTYKLLVVTDGEAGDDNLNNTGSFNDGTNKPGVLNDIVSRGVIVDAIGLDMKGDHSLATQINGNYMRGDDPDTLVKAVQKSIHAEVNFNDGGIGEDIFKEVSELPDSFANSVITALTTYQNYPIGEMPPISVVNEDGTISLQPNPSNEVVVPSVTLRDGAFVMMTVFGIVIAFGVILLITVNKGR